MPSHVPFSAPSTRWTKTTPTSPDRRARGRSRSGLLRIGAVSVVAALVSAFFVTSPAQAATNDTAEAEGSLLSGTGLVGLDDIAQLRTAYSGFGGTDVGGAVNDPLSLSVVNALNVRLGNDITLLGSNGILTLGAAGQYANSSATGATASSGTLGANGALGVGNGVDGEGATVNLTPLLTTVPGVSNVLSTGQLQVGALGSSITATRGATVSTATSYQIASAKLRLQSPAVAGLSTSLAPAVTQLQTGVNGALNGTIAGAATTVEGPLEQALGPILGGVLDLSGTQVTGTANLDLAPVLTQTLAASYTEGPVTIVPSTGSVVIDLSKVSDLNGKAPNTSLLTTGAVTTINTAITKILTDDVPNTLRAAITTAVNSTAVTLKVTATARLAGIPLAPLTVTVGTSIGGILGVQGAAAPTVSLTGLGLTGALLSSALTAVTRDVVPGLLTTVRGVVSPIVGPTALATLGTTLTTITTAVNTLVTTTTPITTILRQVIDVVVNAQDTSTGFRDARGTDAGAASVHALRLAILPGANVANVDLGTSTVRATTFVAPTITAPTTNQVFSVPGASSTRSVTIGGAGEPGAQISVAIGGGRTGTATVGTNGQWSTSITGVPVGSYTATATQTVGGQAAGSATQSFSVVAQAALTIATPSVGQTFTVIAPGATTTVTVTGTATAGSTVAVDLGGGRTGTGTAAADGTYSVAVANVPVGSYTASVTQTVGDTTSTPVTRAFSVVASAALTVTSPADGSDYPVADASGTRNIPFTGTAQPGAGVTVDLGAGLTATTTAAGDGSWAATVQNVPVGSRTASVTQTVGGVVSAPVTRTVSVTAGPALRITTPAPGTTYTVADAGSTTPVTVSGSAAPNATVDVSIGGAFAATVTAGADGGWTTTFAGVPVGPRTATATQTVAGTTSAPVTAAFSVAPGAPLVITAPTDGRTFTVVDQDATATVPVTGTAQPGASVRVSLGGAFVSTVTADATTGAWSTSFTGVPVGTRTVSVVQTVGGTVSPAQTRAITVAAGAPLTVAAPVQGSSITVAQSTSTLTVPVSGTAQPSATVRVALDGGTPVTTTAAADGTWSVDLPGVGVGPHTARVTQVVAGATSSPIDRAFTVATGAPLAITTPTADQQIPASSSGTANVVATGTAQPGATVSVSFDAGTPVVVTADPRGDWTAPAGSSVALPVGPHRISVTQTVNGTDSATATRDFAVVAGRAVAIDLPPTGARYTVVDDTATTPVVVTGTAAVGAPVTVTITGGTTRTTTATDGTWTVTFPAVGTGSYTVNASQDVAGDVTNALPTTFVVSAAAPVAITTPTTTPPLRVAGPLTAIDVPVTGTAQPGAVVDVTTPGAPAQRTTAGADGSWTVTFPALGVGPHTVSATETVGGQTSATAVTRTFSIEAATSVAIATPASGATLRVPDGGGTRPVVVTGTAAADAPVTVTLDGTTLPTTASPDGDWTVTFPGVGVGPHTLSASQTVNGTTASSAAQPLTIAPSAALAVTDPAQPTTSVVVADTSARIDLPVSGTAAGGATVTATLSDGRSRTVTATGGTWSTSFTDLAPGEYTVVVTQTVDGLVSQPVTRAVTVTAGSPLVVTEPAGDVSRTVADAAATRDVPFSGTGQVGAVVTVDLGQGRTATATVDGSGAWSTTVEDVPAGRHAGSVVQTVSGTTSAAVGRVVTIVVAPTLAIRQPADGSTITVAQADSTTTATVAGDAAPGATVSLTVDGGTPVTTTADADGDWSVDLAGLGTGTHRLAATQTIDGSTSSVVRSTFTVEAGAPLEVTAPVRDQAFTVADDTATTTVTVTGTAEPDATVVVELGGDRSASVQADGDGAWSVDVTGVPAGDQVVHVTQRVGDTTSTAVDVPIRVGVADPIAIARPGDGSTIAVAQGDSTTTVTVSGSAQAAATVRVRLDDGPVTTVTAGRDGAWSADFPGVAVGNHRASATQTIAGSTSAAVATAFTVAPGDTLTVTDPTPGATVTVVDDGTTASIPVAGTAQADATVVVSLSGSTPVTTTAGDDGRWSTSVPGVAVGPHTLSVTQTVGDTTSSPVTQSLTVRAATALEIGSPAIGATITVADADQTATIGVSGTAQAGATIDVAIGAGRTATTTAAANGTWSVSIGGVPVGARTIVATQTVGGRESAPVSRPIRVAAGADLVVRTPADGASLVVAGPDARASVVVSGSAEPGATIAVDLGAAGTATTTAGPGGAWSVTIDGVPVGGHTVAVTQSVNGTTSAAVEHDFSVDAGAGIVIQTPATGTTYTVVGADGTRDVVVSGVAAPGADVTVRTGGDTQRTSADATDGTWSVTFADLGVDGYTVEATQDVDGTTADAQATTFSIRAAAGVVIATPTAGTTVRVADAGQTATIPVSGTAEPGASVTVTIGGRSTTTTAGPTGAWSGSVAGVAVGDRTISVTQALDGVTSTAVTRPITVAAAAAVVIATPETGAVTTVFAPATGADVVVTGTAEPRAVIGVDLGFGHTATTRADADGAWSATVVGVPEGSFTAAVTQVVNGTTSAPVNRDVTIDVAAALGVDTPTDGATLPGVGTGGTATVTVTGSAEPGARVDVSLGDDLTGRATAGTDGRFSITIDDVPTGTHVVTTTQTVGGTRSDPDTRTVTVAPAAGVVITAPATGTTITVADADQTATVPVRGTAAPGAAISVTVGAGTPVTTTADGSGAWSVSVPGVAVGSPTVSVTQTLGGTTSDPTTRPIVVASGAPVTIRTPGNGDRIAVAGDDGTASVVVAGSAEPRAQVTVDLGSGRTGRTTAGPDGSWSVTIDGVPVGPQTASVSQTVGGTTSAAVTRAFEVVGVDGIVIQTPPSGTVYTVVGATGTRDVVVTGVADPGAAVSVDLGGDPETTTADAVDGSWTVTFPALGVDSYTVHATQTVDGAPSSAVDTTFRIRAAAAVTVSSPGDGDRLTIVDGSGVLDVPFRGTAEPGAVVTVDLGGGLTASVAAPDGTWSLTVADVPTGSYTAKVTEVVGGVESAATTVDLTVRPAAPVVIDTPTDGATPVAFGPATTVTVPVSGSAEPGATVTVSLGAGTTPVTTTAGDGGAWSVTVPGVGDGPHTVSVTQTTGGVTSDPETRDITVVVADGVTITSPVIGTPVLTAAPDGTATVPVAGTAEPGASVTVDLGGGHTATVTADGDGNWSADVPGVPSGVGIISVTETVSGATSAPVVQPVTVGAAAPLTIAPPNGGAPYTVGTRTDTTPVVVSGTAAPNASVTVRVDGGTARTTTAGPSGAWSTTVPGVGVGTHTASATQTVGGGTSAAVSTTFSVRPTAAPVISNPANGASLPAGTGGTTDTTIRGTAAPLATVTVVVDGGTPVTVAAGLDGAWSVPANGLGVGPHRVVATQTVDGSVSEPASTTFTVSAAVPAGTIVITSPAPNELIPDTGANGVQDLVVSGIATPGALVTVTLSNGDTLTTRADAAGRWTVTFRNLAVGRYTITATQEVDGRSTSSDPQPVVLEAVAPLVVISPTNGETRQANADGTVDWPMNGTAEPGATVSISIDGGTPVTVTADPVTGAWSVVIRNVRVGAHVVSVTQTVDGATTAPQSSVVIVTAADTDPGTPGTPGTPGGGLPGMPGTGSGNGIVVGTGTGTHTGTGVVSGSRTGGLAFTGSDVLPLGGAGLGILLLGLLLLGLSRFARVVRRRSRQ